MTDLKKAVQRGTGTTSSVSDPRGDEADERNQGQRFGASEPGTAGTNRDADERGESKNQGHGHAREDRSGNSD